MKNQRWRIGDGFTLYVQFITLNFICYTNNSSKFRGVATSWFVLICITRPFQSTAVDYYETTRDQ